MFIKFIGKKYDIMIFIYTFVSLNYKTNGYDEYSQTTNG